MGNTRITLSNNMNSHRQIRKKFKDMLILVGVITELKIARKELEKIKTPTQWWLKIISTKCYSKKKNGFLLNHNTTQTQSANYH